MSPRNLFLVGTIMIAGEIKIRILGYRALMAGAPMKREEALNLAAHLVALADLHAPGQANHDEFRALLHAVENT